MAEQTYSGHQPTEGSGLEGLTPPAQGSSGVPSFPGAPAERVAILEAALARADRDLIAARRTIDTLTATIAGHREALALAATFHAQVSHAAGDLIGLSDGEAFVIEPAGQLGENEGEPPAGEAFITAGMIRRAGSQ